MKCSNFVFRAKKRMTIWMQLETFKCVVKKKMSPSEQLQKFCIS